MRARKPHKTPPLSFYEVTSEYTDEKSAARYFERKRWPGGVTCVACGSKDIIKGDTNKRRRQLYFCRQCNKQFSVTSGTIMEATKLPLRKWLLAYHLMGASKKGMSGHQLSRMLKVTYKTAWHLSHRIRATMTQNSQLFSGIVETDETYLGGRRKKRGRGYKGNKIAVQTIVERNTKGLGKRKGRAQTIALKPGGKVDGRTVGAKLRKHTKPKNTILMTDDSAIYNKVGEGFAEHHTVNHSKEEYVRRDPDGHLVTTNTAEGLFANLKRQIHGTHHHTSKKHLPKYLEEYDFKYNTREKSDAQRTEDAIENMEGKRLRLYKTVGVGEASLFENEAGEPFPKKPRKREKPPQKAKRRTKR